jgi:hypothetical protein
MQANSKERTAAQRGSTQEFFVFFTFSVVRRAIPTEALLAELQQSDPKVSAWSARPSGG